MMRVFDCALPVCTRDGQPVTIWARRWGLLMGCVHTGPGCWQALTWGEITGMRVDTPGHDPLDLMNTPQPCCDAYVQDWASVYIEGAFRSRGIRFDAFLLAPEEIVEAVASTPDAAPLLPRQAEVMREQLERELPPDTRIAGDRYLEPWRHHAFYRPSRTPFRARRPS